MVHYCCVYTCNCYSNSTNEGLSFHGFPSDKQLEINSFKKYRRSNATFVTYFIWWPAGPSWSAAKACYCFVSRYGFQELKEILKKISRFRHIPKFVRSISDKKILCALTQNREDWKLELAHHCSVGGKQILSDRFQRRKNRLKSSMLS